MESQLSKEWECVLCGDFFIGRGHSQGSGRCCTGCNEKTRENEMMSEETRAIAVKKSWECVLCGEIHTGWGNNPEPVKSFESGRCCAGCNERVVIPERTRIISKRLLEMETEHEEDDPPRECNHCGGDMSDVEDEDVEVCKSCEQILRAEAREEDIAYESAEKDRENHWGIPRGEL